MTTPIDVGPAAQSVLDAVITAYTSSGDFNGLPLGASAGALADTVEPLVRAGLIQVVSEADYPNPHIRPWPSTRSVDAQVQGLRKGASSVLYPTPAAMVGNDALATFADRPFTLAMASGRGCLELAYFSAEAIEVYRNDPRYHFTHHDFGAGFGIGDDAYLDDSEPDRDKIHSIEVGFAYDADALDADQPEVRRYVCAFLGDLAKLTPAHQQRWRTWENQGDLTPHPVWWSMQMGEWPDGVGPFDKILGEIEAVNELWSLLYGQALFKSVDRPRGWGWVLRSSTTEWESFVLMTDKLLSDNIRHAALDAAGVSRTATDGTTLGTLARLETWMTLGTSVTSENARHVMQPLRDVRKARQRPAHSLDKALTDKTLVTRQRDLLGDVAGTLQALREFLARHPKARRSGWAVPDHLNSNWYVL